jgi:diguanylate cyclase (GGDEF)-like protein
VLDLHRANLELETALAQLEATKQELLALNDALERQATTDALTGLKNRIVFQNSIVEMIAVAERHGSTLTLLLVDIDHFKRVNDTRGHQEGDRVLRAVSHALAAHVREQDIVARFGGEEFAVLLPNTELVPALTVAEHLRRACRNAVRIEPRLTVSIGVAEYAPGDSEVTLIGRADAALYAAKAQGRDRVVATAEPAPGLA